MTKVLNLFSFDTCNLHACLSVTWFQNAVVAVFTDICNQKMLNLSQYLLKLLRVCFSVQFCLFIGKF